MMETLRNVYINLAFSRCALVEKSMNSALWANERMGGRRGFLFPNRHAPHNTQGRFALGWTVLASASKLVSQYLLLQPCLIHIIPSFYDSLYTCVTTVDAWGGGGARGLACCATAAASLKYLTSLQTSFQIHLIT